MRLIDAIGLKQALVVSAILEDKKTIEQIIDEQPTIEPERKTGRWIDITTDESIDVEYKCSECGFEMFLWSNLTNFCPNCGAKMEGGES